MRQSRNFRFQNKLLETRNSAKHENFCDKRAQSQTRLNYVERNKNLA